MSKMIGNYVGLHFVAAVGVCELVEGISKHPTLSGQAKTFLGLADALVSLTIDELWSMGGFAITLQPGQVLEIPAGWAP